MEQNTKDANRFAEITYRGKTLFKGPLGWPMPGASFDNVEVQQQILDAVGVPLRVPDYKLPQFWQLAETSCIIFARDFQTDLAPHPTAVEVRTARAAAERLIAAMEPILGQDPVRSLAGQTPNYFATKFLKDLSDLVHHLDENFKPRHNRQQRNAGRTFIPRMMRLFTASFKRPASEAPDGYFADFVMACLAKTQGLPEELSRDWVQKHVGEHNKEKRAAR